MDFFFFLFSSLFISSYSLAALFWGVVISYKFGDKFRWAYFVFFSRQSLQFFAWRSLMERGEEVNLCTFERELVRLRFFFFGWHLRAVVVQFGKELLFDAGENWSRRVERVTDCGGCETLKQHRPAAAGGSVSRCHLNAKYVCKSARTNGFIVIGRWDWYRIYSVLCLHWT